MSDWFRTPEDYELFLYSLADRYRTIQRSTLTFIRIGSTLAKVRGELFFDGGLRVVVRERLEYNRLPMVLTWYGYEVYRNDEKLYWYDSQPHPNDETLQSTHPHHKHIHPDIKHNRVPAPEMSFLRPNLPAIIAEIETMLTSRR